MKYWRGYLTAVIFGVFTWALQQLAKDYSTLVDMIYPYVTRSIQSILTAWTSGVDTCVWQLFLLLGVVILLASLVLVIILRGNVVRWGGWACACVSILFCLYTGIYGLNQYAGPIEEDLRLDMVDYTQSELEDAAVFYRDMANELAAQVARDEKGDADFADFAELAAQTGNGYKTLTTERSFSVFGGDYTPVKELGWSGLFAAMGNTGVTCALTGEAAVNTKLPDVALPFAMAKEMAHRLCITREDDALFSAYLNCQFNDSIAYQYSGYLMAYRYCYVSLCAVDEAAAETVAAGCTAALQQDLDAYSDFFNENLDKDAEKLGKALDNVYLLASGTKDGGKVYGSFCDYLVNWYIEEYVEEEEVEAKFDPYDETQVDLSGLPNYTAPAATETESGE